MAPAPLITKASAWVKPAGPVKAEVVELSAIDNQCAQVYPCGFWFFPENAEQREPMFHFEQMKRGLARILYHQPLNCGILKQTERGTFNVEIPEDAGARFYYQDVTHDPGFPTMQQIAHAKYPVIDGGVDGFKQLRPDPFPTSSDGDPVFICQLTKMRGGMVVFATCTHLLGDLLQPRMTLCGWAEQVKVVADADKAGVPVPPLPRRFPDAVYDRSRFSPKATKEMTYDEVSKVVDGWGKYFILDPTQPEIAAEKMQKTFPPAHVLPSEMHNEDYLRAHIGGLWTMKLENLHILGHLAKQHTEWKLSTVDVVIAFIWQRFYIAKYGIAAGGEAAPQRPSNPAVVFPGDVRQRLTPPLPQMYLGAAVDLFKATLPEADLLPKEQTPEEFGKCLARAGERVRNANTQFSEERYMQLIDMAVSLPKHTVFLPTGPLDLLITDHTRNKGLRNADWGPGLGLTPELRQPYFGRDMPPGEITLMPRCNNGDMELMITSERVVLQRLLDDEVFSRFAENIFVAYNAREALCAQHSSPPIPRL